MFIYLFGIFKKMDYGIAVRYSVSFHLKMEPPAIGGMWRMKFIALISFAFNCLGIHTRIYCPKK